MAKKIKWMQGTFTPKNPDKYIGDKLPKYKSGWEWTFMEFCDNNPNIKSWAYEPIKIPYFNPIKQKQSIYLPDFLIHYIDKNGNEHTELIEIKPEQQTKLTSKSKLKEQIEVSMNHAKWKEAVKWAKHRGITFRILTKEDIYLK